jgi:hypothetical protein
MSGSEKVLKASLPNEVQLPLKGFYHKVESPHSKRTVLIEGMGEGRYRIHFKKSAKRP